MAVVATISGSVEPKRGRPRRPGVGDRVRAAAIEELIEGGLESFSITKVARRAGVAKGTVSLRWPEPLDLVLEALSSRLVWEDVPESDDLGQELLVLSERLDPAHSAPLFGLIHSVLGASAARPQSWSQWRERIVWPGLTLAQGVFDRAAARGDIGPGVDRTALIKLFIGGLQLATQANPELGPPSSADRRALIDLVLSACQ